MKHDIQHRKDINKLVHQFYEKLLNDDLVSHFFQEIVEQDLLEKHLKVITDFWEDILLDTVKYGRNALKPHLALNLKHPFSSEHFERWLHHFNTTIDANFKGKKALLAKTRALSIATVMKIKMKDS